MKRLMLLVSLLLVLVSSQASIASENSWYYSFDEVTKLYKVHYDREGRIDNYIHEIHKGKYIARVGDSYIEVPPEFIKYIQLHLWNAIENGWVNYIFWPDLNHGHLFVPIDLWENKYSGGGDSTEVFHAKFQRLLKEDMDKLGILYHAAEHFGHYDPANKEAIQTRNVIGWFDGRPIELTYPAPDESPGRLEANTADDPPGYDRRWFISVSASKYGQFTIRPNGEEVRFDISFDEKDIYDSTTYPRKKPKNDYHL
jgi:hypothetical protein